MEGPLGGALHLTAPALHRGPVTPTLAPVPKTTGERWMGVPEAAEYLGVGLRTVYSFIAKGWIPAYKLGRVIRVKTADVDAFLETRRIEPGTLGRLYRPAKGHEEEDG